MEQPWAGTLIQRLRQAQASLSEAERKVAGYIMHNPVAALTASAAAIAASAGTSDATVIRTARALGFSGLGSLRQELARSLAAMPGLGVAPNPADDLRRSLAASGEDVETAIRMALTTIRRSLDELLEHAGLLRQAVRALHPARRIVVFGIGPTAAIARYAAALLSRTGWRTRLLDSTGRALADQLLELDAADGLLMLSYGVPYREAITTRHEAARLGLQTVLLTDHEHSELTRGAAVVVPVRRGDGGQVALHGATVAALEAIVLGLATADPAISTDALDRLNRLRAELDPSR